jgi:hypothetical protein
MVDIAEVGFQRLANNKQNRNFPIRTIQIDLDEPDALKSENKFDSIVCINFKPQLALLRLFSQLLLPNGTFLLCSFNELQAAETGFPLDKSLKFNEFIDFFPDFVLLDYQRFEDETGKRDGYLFRRNAW